MLSLTVLYEHFRASTRNCVARLRKSSSRGAAIVALVIGFILMPTRCGLLAATVEGGALFVSSTDDVIATYLGNSASYTDDLYLESPPNSLGLIFRNHANPIGDTLDLGTFPIGTELIFRLHVLDTGYDFYSGPASRNPDDHAHALVTYDITPTSTLVQFEDLFGGPFNYNDLSFSFTSVSVPEPSGTALIMTAAVLLAAAAIYRRRRSVMSAPSS